MVAKSLKWIFTFGKYKGRTLKEVIERDSSYITWCLEKVKDFTLKSKAEALYNHYVEVAEDGANDADWPEMGDGPEQEW